MKVKDSIYVIQITNESGLYGTLSAKLWDQTLVLLTKSFSKSRL